MSIDINFPQYFTQMAYLIGWVFICAGAYAGVERLIYGAKGPPEPVNDPAPQA